MRTTMLFDRYLIFSSSTLEASLRIYQANLSLNNSNYT